MKKKFLFNIVFVFFCVNIVMGQDSLRQEVVPFPKVILTFSPLNLINLRVPAAQIGIEYRIAKKLSLQHEAGYVFRKNNTNSETQFLNKKGFRLRNELRYYFDGMDGKNKSYFGLQFRYWKFNSPVESTYWREGGQYQQQITLDVDQSGIGGGVSYGDNIITTKKLIFDVGASAGFIQVKNRPSDLPDDAESMGNVPFFGRDHSVPYNSTQPYFLLTFKFGFAL